MLQHLSYVSLQNLCLHDVSTSVVLIAFILHSPLEVILVSRTFLHRSTRGLSILGVATYNKIHYSYCKCDSQVLHTVLRLCCREERIEASGPLGSAVTANPHLDQVSSSRQGSNSSSNSSSSSSTARIGQCTSESAGQQPSMHQPHQPTPQQCY
jgi:hypothetical protein